MEYGMPFLMETDTLEECARLCSHLGLDFIELNMNFPQCQLPELQADRLRRIMDQEHLYFTIHLDENLNVCDFNPKVRQAYLETAVETIELAKAIGAPVINMHLAKGIYLTLPGRKEYLFKRMKRSIGNILRNLERCAGTQSVTRLYTWRLRIRKDLWNMRSGHWNFCCSSRVSD